MVGLVAAPGGWRSAVGSAEGLRCGGEDVVCAPSRIGLGRLACLLALLIVGSEVSWGGQGPGLGNLTYTEDELFQPVSWIDQDNGVPEKIPDRKPFGLNVGIMLNGYFVTVFAPDSGKGPGGFLICDVSDPRNIRLERRIYDPTGETSEIREAHSLGVARIDGSVYVAVASASGVEFWDFTGVNDIRRVSKLTLPGVAGGDYERVAWQLFWQAPYLYVAVSSPDQTPPSVVAVSPRDGAVRQAVTTRVGVASSDAVLFESLTADAVQLLDPEGNAVDRTYSAQLGIANFSPAAPLRANATYTVNVVAGDSAVSDYVGNRVTAAFSSTFTTGPATRLDPIHRWPLAGDASDWFDRNNGTVVGARFEDGGGLRLGGDGQWVKLDNDLSPALAGDASLAFFLSTTQIGGASAAEAPGLTGRVDPAQAAVWGWLDAAGQLRLSAGDGAGIASPDAVNDGELHHYVLTRDSVSGNLRMYRDGLLFAEGAGPAGTMNGGGAYDRLGAIEGSAAGLQGLVDDIQVFDRVLDSESVRLFRSTRTGFSPGTLDAETLVGVAAAFEAVAQGDDTTTYHWDFGDGTARGPSTDPSATHAYAQPACGTPSR